jgi:hypothetical protein
MDPDKTNTNPEKIVKKEAKKGLYSQDLLVSVLDRLEKSGYKKDSPEYLYFRDTPFAKLDPDLKKWWVIDEVRQTLYAGFQHRDLSVKKWITEKQNIYLEKVVEYIEKYYCKDFSELQDFIIYPQQYLIQLVFAHGNVSIPFHPNAESIIINDLSRRGELKNRIKTGEEKLKEDIDTESYMDGNLIVVYKTAQKIAENGILPALALWWAIGTVQWWVSTARRWARSMVGQELIRAGRSAADPWIELGRRIDSIHYRDLNGKMQKVDVSDIWQLNIEKWKAPSHLFSLLEQKGIVMDPSTGRFSPVAHLTMRDVVRNFEYMQAPQWVHPDDWKKFQSDIRMIEREYRQWVNTGKISPTITALKDFLDNRFTRGWLQTAKWMKWKMIHVILWPVFFKTYHANMQDRGARNASLAEGWAFAVWAKIGSKVPLPPAFKPIATLVWWGIAVMGGEHLAEKFELDKKYWAFDPEREDYDYKENKKDGNSKLSNALGWGFLYRQLDRGKSDIAITPKDGMDLRFGYNTPTMKNWRLSFDRNDNQDTFLPRIAFLETSISFQTNPREYMGMAMGRDVELWNTRVEEYRKWLTNAIEALHDDYKKQNGIFRVSNIQKVSIDPDSEFYQNTIVAKWQIDPKDPDIKNTRTVLAYDKSQNKLVPVIQYDEMEMRRKYLFSLRITQMLGLDGYEQIKKLWNSPQSVQNSYIMRSIANRSTDWIGSSEEKRKNNTQILVANMVDQLKIDKTYMQREALDLRTRELALTERLRAFSEQFSGEKRKYVLDLFRRIRAREKMVDLRLPSDVKALRSVDNGVVVHTGPGKWDPIPGRPGIRWDTKVIPSMEWTWWKELLESKDIYTRKDRGENSDALGKIEERNIEKGIDFNDLLKSGDLKSGDVFYQLLKEMVEFKRHEQFIQNIEQSGTWQKWYGSKKLDFLYDIKSPSPGSIWYTAP